MILILIAVAFFAKSELVEKWNSWKITFANRGESFECLRDPPLSVYSCFLSHRPAENIDAYANDAKLQWIGFAEATVSGAISVVKNADKWYILELADVDSIAEVFLNGI